MTTGDIAERQASNPAETDDIIRTNTARAAGKPSRGAERKKKNETDDIARPESKQEATAKPYYSRKNAQFRSQPELYKNDRKRDTAG